MQRSTALSLSCPTIKAYQFIDATPTERSDIVSLRDAGISYCSFTSSRHVNSAGIAIRGSQLNVHALATVPFAYKDHKFSHQFLVVENVFPQEAYKEHFVAILGSDFVKKFFIRAEWTGADYTKPNLLQAPSTNAATLQICTHGFFLASGLDQSQDLLAMTGYGVLFLSLGKDWNLSAALAPDVPHTKTQAEITAVVRAAQLVLKRGPLLTNAFKDIVTYTDSCAVTSGLENYQPRHDHGTPHALLPDQFTKLGLFSELDRALAEINRRLKPVKIDYLIPENNEAVKLAIEGAQRR